LRLKRTEIFLYLSASLSPQDIPKIRGAIASDYPELTLLHNHNGNELRYATPLVQYRVIDREVLLVGVASGAEVLRSISFDQEQIKIGGLLLNILERRVIFSESILGVTQGYLFYSFLTPWLALNEENHRKYQRLRSWNEKKEMLSKILIGNIIAMSKGLGYTVPAPIEVEMGHLREVPARLKGTPMIGFLGDFKVNFAIPDYLGLGKSVSRGFGTIKRIKTEEKNMENNTPWSKI
jgi:hypothetical protein